MVPLRQRRLRIFPHHQAPGREEFPVPIAVLSGRRRELLLQKTLTLFSGNRLFSKKTLALGQRRGLFSQKTFTPDRRKGLFLEKTPAPGWRKDLFFEKPLAPDRRGSDLFLSPTSPRRRRNEPERRYSPLSRRPHRRIGFGNPLLETFGVRAEIISRRKNHGKRGPARKKPSPDTQE